MLKPNAEHIQAAVLAVSELMDDATTIRPLSQSHNGLGNHEETLYSLCAAADVAPDLLDDVIAELTARYPVLA